MSKINEWLLDKEQQGQKAFEDTPDWANDAHGEDNRVHVYELTEEQKELFYGAKK